MQRPTRRFVAVLLGALVGAGTALGALSLTGCVKSCQKTSGPRAARDDLDLLPKEADIVFMANLKRARGTKMWEKLLLLRDQDEAAKKRYEEIKARCQFDVATQLDSLFLALPQDARESREFALIARGSFSDNLVDCLKTLIKENTGKDTIETDYKGRKLHGVEGQDFHFVLLAQKVMVLAGKAWVKKIVDQHDAEAPGSGLKAHKELFDLMKLTRTGDALWGAGLVPEKVSEELRQNPQLGVAASMKSVAGSVDFQKGMLVHLHIDMPSPAEAGELAKKVGEQLAAAKSAPKVQMLGLSGYFDAVKVAGKESAFTARVELSQEQVDDLSTRLSGLLKGLGTGP